MNPMSIRSTFGVAVILLIAQTCTAAFINCPVKQYYDSTSNSCLSCYSSCQYCSDSLNTSCYSCVSGYYLYNSTCVSSCPTGYLRDTINGLCTICLEYCSVCASNKIAYNNTCLDSCPQQTSLITVNGATTCVINSETSAPIIIPVFDNSSVVPYTHQLIIKTTVNSQASTVLQWNSNINLLFSGVVTTQSNLVIPKINLSPGQNYVLTLLARNEIGTSILILNFTMASTLPAGYFVAYPTSGTAMKTSFTFQAINFNTNAPLFIDVTAVENILSDDPALLIVGGISTRSSLTITKKNLINVTIPDYYFPPSSADKNYTVTLRIYNLMQETILTKQLAVTMQSSSDLANINQLGSGNSLNDVSVIAEALNLLIPQDSTTQCFMIKTVMNYARAMNLLSTCLIQECASNGSCGTGSNQYSAGCFCATNYFGRCCEFNNSNNTGIQNLALFSTLIQESQSSSLDTKTAGFLASFIQSVSKKAEFLSQSQVETLISSLNFFMLNPSIIDAYLGYQLIDSITSIYQNTYDLFTTSEWQSVLTIFSNLTDTILTNIAGQNQIKQAVYLNTTGMMTQIESDFGGTLFTSSGLNIDNAGSSRRRRRLTTSTITEIEPSPSANAIRLSLGSNVLVVPDGVSLGSFQLATMVFSSYQTNFLSSDFSTDIIDMYILQSNGTKYTPFSSLTFTSLLKKNVPTNDSLALYSCVRNINSTLSALSTESCSLYAENFTHIVCQCTGFSNRVVMGAILNTSTSNTLSLNCLVEGYKNNLQDPNTQFLDVLGTGPCFPVIFRPVGVYFVLCLAAVFILGILLVRRVEKVGVSEEFRPSLTLLPLYSIYRAPTLPYESRYLKFCYIYAHFLDMMFSSTHALTCVRVMGGSYYIYWAESWFTSIWFLEYATIGFWHFLYRQERGQLFWYKKINKRARYAIVILCYIFNYTYLIVRWGFLTDSEIYTAVLNGLLYVGGDFLFWDPLIILLTKIFPKTLSFFRYRGYYVPGDYCNEIYNLFIKYLKIVEKIRESELEDIDREQEKIRRVKAQQKRQEILKMERDAGLASLRGSEDSNPGVAPSQTEREFNKGGSSDFLTLNSRGISGEVTRRQLVPEGIDKSLIKGVRENKGLRTAETELTRALGSLKKDHTMAESNMEPYSLGDGSVRVEIKKDTTSNLDRPESPRTPRRLGRKQLCWEEKDTTNNKKSRRGAGSSAEKYRGGESKQVEYSRDRGNEQEEYERSDGEEQDEDSEDRRPERETNRTKQQEMTRQTSSRPPKKK